MDKKMFNVGKIVNTHGIKGEVKVVKITDFEERFAEGSRLHWFSEQGGEPVVLTVDGHRRHKNFDLLHFEGFNSINEVEQFKNGMLKVEESQLSELDEGEFYYHEIIGCYVYTTAREKLGIIKEVLSPGANDVWVVKRDNQKDLLVPYIEEVVKEVSIEEKEVVIEPMEGLLD